MITVTAEDTGSVLTAPYEPGATLSTLTVVDAVRQVERDYGWCTEAEDYVERLLDIRLKPRTRDDEDYCCTMCSGMSRKKWEERRAANGFTERFTPDDSAPTEISVSKIIRALKTLARARRTEARQIGRAIFGSEWVGFPQRYRGDMAFSIDTAPGVTPTDEQLQAVIDQITPELLRARMYLDS